MTSSLSLRAKRSNPESGTGLLRHRRAQQAPGLSARGNPRNDGQMRVIFMGSPDFAVPTLYALITAKHDVAAVYSQPPRRAGRGKGLQQTPVHRAAELLGTPVHTPTSLKSAEQQ